MRRIILYSALLLPGCIQRCYTLELTIFDREFCFCFIAQGTSNCSGGGHLWWDRSSRTVAYVIRRTCMLSNRLTTLVILISSSVGDRRLHCISRATEGERKAPLFVASISSFFFSAFFFSASVVPVKIHCISGLGPVTGGGKFCFTTLSGASCIRIGVDD